MVKTIFLNITMLFALLMPLGVSAQSVDVLRDICKKEPEAAACKDRVGDSKDVGQNPIYGPNGIVTKVVNVLSIIVGIAAIISIIVAGIKFIGSGSNPQEVTRARELVIYAIVGLILAATAQILIRYVLSETAIL